jgi:hypothetical protein
MGDGGPPTNEGTADAASSLSITTVKSAGPADSLKAKSAHLWARDPHDWYVEPEAVSAALFRAQDFAQTIWDPACGRNNILRGAAAAGYETIGSDIVNRTAVSYVADFLAEDREHPDADIVCNPPFKYCSKAADFIWIRRCIQKSRVTTALLLPSNWDCGSAVARFIDTTSLYRIYQLCPRPSMPPGRVIQAGIKPGGGRQDFSWFVWLRGYTGHPTKHWLNWKEKRNAETSQIR